MPCWCDEVKTTVYAAVWDFGLSTDACFFLEVFVELFIYELQDWIPT